MSATSVTTTIKFRSDTASNWTAADPVLQQGELGFEYDTLKFKIGNGIDCWNDIENPYLTSSASGDILISDKIVHVGDADTAIRFPEDDTFQVETAGGVRLKIDSSGNVGINTDSPNKKLEVRGALNGSDGVRINEISDTYHDLLASGGNFYIHADSKGDDGSANVLRFGVGSDGERMRINSSGKVGIGTTDPSTLLEISQLTSGDGSDPAALRLYGKRSGAFTASAPSAEIQFYSNDANGPGAMVRSKISNVAIDTTGAQQGLAFYTTGSSAGDAITERVRINHNGLVGIGTLTPGALLDLSSATPIIRFSDTDTTGYDQIQSKNANFVINSDPSNATASSSISFNVDGDERMRIDSSGRVIIGGTSSVQTSSQDNRLQIQGTNQATGRISIQRVSADTGGAGIHLAKARSSSFGIVQEDDQVGIIAFNPADGTDYAGQCANIQCYIDGTPGVNDVPGRLSFHTAEDGATSPTERMRITRTGRLTTYSTDGTANIITSSRSAGTSNRIISLRHSSSGVNGGTESLLVYTNGNVQNTNNSYGALSDIKLKENIIDANSQWDDLKSLRVRNYNLKEGQTHTQIGLVAQEAELVSPGLVSESPDHDEEGNDLGTVTKSVNYSVLYMKAVKALQEAMERIEVLEQRLSDAGIN